MIAGNRRASLEGRVERIERAIAEPPPVEQPLSRHELRELLELERERALQFPVPIDDMAADELTAFMAYHCNGASTRLAHLRERARSPEERAEGRAMTVAIEAMSADTLAEFMAEMALCSPEPAKGNRPCS